MENILIAGISGHAKVIIDIVEKEGKYNIAGLIDKTYTEGVEILGYPVLGRDEDILSLMDSHSIAGGIIGVCDNWLRFEIYQKIKNICPHFKFFTTVHPSANITKETSIGQGTVIMAQAVVNPCTSIGDFCVINTNASIDHDSIMESFSSLAPKTVLGGNVHIGSFSAVGIGATIIQGISIEKHTVIGAGSVVLENIDPFVVAYGVPAKIVRHRKKNDKYL